MDVKLSSNGAVGLGLGSYVNVVHARAKRSGERYGKVG